jgi:hypothetical protein
VAPRPIVVIRPERVVHASAEGPSTTSSAT